MPQYMHGHRFLYQRRTNVGGFPDVFGKPVLESVPAEPSSSLCGEQRGFWLTGPLGQTLMIMPTPSQRSPPHRPGYQHRSA